MTLFFELGRGCTKGQTLIMRVYYQTFRQYCLAVILRIVWINVFKLKKVLSVHIGSTFILDHTKAITNVLFNSAESRRKFRVVLDRLHQFNPAVGTATHQGQCIHPNSRTNNVTLSQRCLENCGQGR